MLWSQNSKTCCDRVAFSELDDVLRSKSVPNTLESLSQAGRTLSPGDAVSGELTLEAIGLKRDTRPHKILVMGSTIAEVIIPQRSSVIEALLAALPSQFCFAFLPSG